MKFGIARFQLRHFDIELREPGPDVELREKIELELQARDQDAAHVAFEFAAADATANLPHAPPETFDRIGVQRGAMRRRAQPMR